MVGAAPPSPVDLYRTMRERGTGLFGTDERVAQQIERYAEIGITHIAFISRFGGMPRQAAAQSLQRLAPTA
jgi:alkanesulfonate monooxygenase SsuD/methylene tetrahydromethanopterin reductase-like flavin-dependent oxidoreductase (luciferase family)